MLVILGRKKEELSKLERSCRTQLDGPHSRAMTLGLLLDLAFLEQDMLAQHGVVLLHGELLRHRARVLLGDVIEAGAAFAVETDFGRGRLRHEKLQRELSEGPVN